MDVMCASLTNIMREKNNNLELCQKETNLLKKCIFSKFHLSSNQWSPLLEKHIKTMFNIGKCNSKTSGDGCSSNRKNIEIKVSLGDQYGQINFVQLRPDHDIDFYIFLAYNLFEGQNGELQWFLCKPDDLYELIPIYGGYAHGSIQQHGKITEENIKGRNLEYVLRANPTKNINTKSRILWTVLVDRFGADESKIRNSI